MGKTRHATSIHCFAMALPCPCLVGDDPGVSWIVGDGSEYARDQAEVGSVASMMKIEASVGLMVGM
jgi:hypothetical protein